ncbi:hypothetical protein QBC43DRAFT_311362 [Cladorrhinum sp. PSN259]|nr:hypothetical protein QBC43DRAFT_311362 [Cladorrhinum sp. PSN259]
MLMPEDSHSSPMTPPNHPDQASRRVALETGKPHAIGQEQEGASATHTTLILTHGTSLTRNGDGMDTETKDAARLLASHGVVAPTQTGMTYQSILDSGVVALPNLKKALTSDSGSVCCAPTRIPMLSNLMFQSRGPLLGILIWAIPLFGQNTWMTGHEDRKTGGGKETAGDQRHKGTGDQPQRAQQQHLRGPSQSGFGAARRQRFDVEHGKTPRPAWHTAPGGTNVLMTNFSEERRPC